MSDDLLRKLRRVFVNRDDVYAQQLDSGGYVKIEKPLTNEVLTKHLSGEITVGAYQLNAENSVKWLCFDFDSEHLSNPEEAVKNVLAISAERVPNEAILLEASRYPDPSYHLWVFFDPLFPAQGGRWLGLRILELAKVKSVELFPKQEALNEYRGYGNLVKLPLGFHRVEKKWSRFLDFETFEPLSNEVIRDIRGLSFSESDTQKILGSRETERGHAKIDLPTNFKPLPNKEEERVVDFLVRYWKHGYRNQIEFYFLGWCIKKGIRRESAYRIIQQVAERTGDEEKQARLNLVNYHYRNRLNIPLKGSSGLREIVKELVKNECHR